MSIFGVHIQSKPTTNIVIFLTIVDDFSIATWTHLLSNKSNAFDFIRYFVSMVNNQFGASVKTVRTDNALELGLSHTTSTFFLEKGISWCCGEET